MFFFLLSFHFLITNNNHEGDKHDMDMDRDSVGEWDSEEGESSQGRQERDPCAGL